MGEGGGIIGRGNNFAFGEFIDLWQAVDLFSLMNNLKAQHLEM